MPTHPGPTHPGVLRGLFLSAFHVSALAAIASAQKLPFRTYSVPEGLANNRVNHVFQDSRGYLWFGTWEGLSRFDGVEFKNYGTPEGLPNFLVNAVAEDPRGRIWVSTQGGGVARLLERSGQRPMFENHALDSTRESNVVVGLYFDAAGNLWCETEAGIYRSTIPMDADLRFERVHADVGIDAAQFACTDVRGRLWICASDGLLEIEGTRVIAKHTPPESSSDLGKPFAVVARAKGGVLAVYSRDVFEVDPPTDASSKPTWRRLELALAPIQQIRCVLFASGGTLWFGTTVGLIRWREGVASTLSTENGLPDISIRSLCEDRDHDLWMGTWSSGAAKLASEAFVNFLVPEAMPDRNALGIFEARDGSMYASGRSGVVRIRGDRAEIVPGSLAPDFTAIGARMHQDRRGDFWIGTARGAWRFSGPDLDMRAGEHLGEKDGLPETHVFGVFHEDPGGGIWVSFEDGRLFRWDPAVSAAPRFARTDLELPSNQAPRAMLSDSRGQLWLAPYVGLQRLVVGRLEHLEASEGLPDLQTRCLFEDHLGDLWIGTRFRGVSVTDEPAAEHPRFRNYSSKNGLASDAVWSVAEDDEGRMYFATSRGLERLDRASGRVRHITTSDGLAGDIVNLLVKDSRGRIWAATSGGISRFDSNADPQPAGPPPTYLSRIRIAGEDLPLSETGERFVPEVTLPSSKDNLLIEFVGLSFRGEREVAYQYELESVDPGWSAPSPQRSVNYAHLAPGSYRFLVRAVHADGAVSAEPASFAFRIRPPYWREWWFLAGAIGLAASIAYALHRSRVRRILALESIRTQIATDIHDDMGSGLSQIAILTEVAKREAAPGAQGYLDEVARLARSMRDSMSDIVWAVDPRRDRFADLVHRMRQAAFNLLEAEGQRVEFRAPADAEIEGIGLAADKRRHLLLVLKEALANVARHARATHVEIDVKLAPDSLRLSIRDDGVGFDPQAEHRGHGVASLRRRAEALAAKLEIRSGSGKGTTIELAVPFHAKPRSPLP